MTSGSIIANTKFMSNTEANVTMILYEKIDSNVNVNQTHINLQNIWDVTPQVNQNIVTCYQRGNQQQQV